MSARFFTAWVPAWRLASCQLMQRWRMSARGSSPKMLSGTVTDPASSPSRVVILSSMSGTLAGGRCVSGVGGFDGRGRRCVRRQPELAGLGNVLRQRLLDGVANRDPPALGTGHRPFDQDEAARDVGLHHLEVERGHPLHAEMAGHFLVLEGLARILTAAG